MKRVLITGAGGFVGTKLAELAASKKSVVFGTVLEKAKQNTVFEEILCDITKPSEVENAVKKSRPEAVFHLAAVSSTAASWQNPVETFSTNAMGTLNLLEAVKNHAPEAKIVFTSSSECYGRVNEKQLPLSESTPLNPFTPYALTKKIGEELLAFYMKQHSIDYSVARFFNICGPGQSEAFVVSSWAKQIAEIEAGKRKPEIAVGNLEVERDFLDARDAVRALWQIAEARGKQKTFNVCSGVPVQLKSILKKMIGVSKQKISFSIHPARVRKTDARKIFGSNALLKKTTRWKQEIPLEQSLKDSVGYWKKIV